MCYAAKPLFQPAPISASRPICFHRPLVSFAKPAYLPPAYSSYGPSKTEEREKKAFWEDYARLMERTLPRPEIIPIGPPDYKKILRDLSKPLGK